MAVRSEIYIYIHVMRLFEFGTIRRSDDSLRISLSLSPALSLGCLWFFFYLIPRRGMYVWRVRRIIGNGMVCDCWFSMGEASRLHVLYGDRIDVGLLMCLCG